MTIPESVIEIRKNAFFESGLTALTLPGSLTNVGINAFEDSPWVILSSGHPLLEDKKTVI